MVGRTYNEQIDLNWRMIVKSIISILTLGCPEKPPADATNYGIIEASPLS